MTTTTDPKTNTALAKRTIRNWHTAQQEKLTLGERSADRMRNFMGSWGFVGGFVAFMVLWALANSLAAKSWDPYPFILLNLFLSMLAGLQGAILLIAAKRQDAIAAALAEHDYNTNVESKIDIEALMKLTQDQCVMLDDLKELIAGQKKELASLARKSPR
ncbi:MAG TPA: DUF1003 domain-containing protein [Galbitalea sp.]